RPHRERLEEELARMPWLASWRLVRPVVMDEQGRVASADLLNGVNRRGQRPFELQLQESDLPRSGGPVRADRDALLLVAPDRRAYLPLFPLARFQFRTSPGAYFLQGCRWRTEDDWRLEQAEYVSYKAGLAHFKEGPGEFATIALERHVAR